MTLYFFFFSNTVQSWIQQCSQQGLGLAAACFTTLHTIFCMFVLLIKVSTTSANNAANVGATKRHVAQKLIRAVCSLVEIARQKIAPCCSGNRSRIETTVDSASLLNDNYFNTAYTDCLETAENLHTDFFSLHLKLLPVLSLLQFSY